MKDNFIYVLVCVALFIFNGDAFGSFTKPFIVDVDSIDILNEHGIVLSYDYSACPNAIHISIRVKAVIRKHKLRGVANYFKDGETYYYYHYQKTHNLDLIKDLDTYEETRFCLHSDYAKKFNISFSYGSHVNKLEYRMNGAFIFELIGKTKLQESKRDKNSKEYRLCQNSKLFELSLTYQLRLFQSNRF